LLREKYGDVRVAVVCKMALSCYLGEAGRAILRLHRHSKSATQLSQRREAFRAFEINEVVNNEKIRPSRLPVDLGNDGGESSGPAKVDPTHYKVILNNKGRYLGRFLPLK
jgi:hypothetical protein